MLATADQITKDASLEVIANFFKFAPVGQFGRLTREQVEILELQLEEAY
jgi:hypothetical protein